MATKTVPLTFKDRLALVGRAVAGSLALDPGSVGGRLLNGVIQPGGSPPTRGTKEYLASYSKMPWLRAVASRVSYDIAAVDWKVYVERRGGRPTRNRMLQRAGAAQRKALLRSAVSEGEVDEIESHPVLDLLANANSMQTGLQMRRVTQLHLDLVGEAFWLIERGALNQPIAVWPVPPSWIIGTPNPRFPFYRVSFRGWQGTIPETEFVWFSDVDPLNPYGRGTGTAQSLSDELETDEYAAKHVKSFFYNNARPDLVVYPKGGGTLTEDNVERLEEDWTAKNQGFWRAFKPYFLRREVEIKELNQGDFRKQQMVPLREFERDTILQVYGVSPETLGILGSGANRATVTMGDHIYSRRVLIPRLELIRSVLQERVMPEFDERIIVDYESPVTKDQEMELDAAKAAPWALTIDEWRRKAGEDPLPAGKGEFYMVPAKVTPAKEFKEPEQDPALDEPIDVEVRPTDDEGGPESRQRALRLAAQVSMTSTTAEAALACLEAGDAAGATELTKLMADPSPDDPPPTRLADQQMGAYRRAQEAAWDIHAFGVNMTALAAAVSGRDEEGAVAALGGLQAFVAALTGPLQRAGRRAFLLGAELALRELPPAKAPVQISLADMNPESARWAEREAARLIVGLSRQARELVRELVVEAVSEGVPVTEVTRRLRDMVGLLPTQAAAIRRLRRQLVADGVSADTIARRIDRYTRAQIRLRAVRIARTELVSATNAGQQALWETAKMRGLLPASTQRIWIVTHDDALDSHVCLPLDGAVAGLLEPFQPGGFMQPPAHPQCRCAIGIKKT